jgi:predicted nucleic acid-binding protein
MLFLLDTNAVSDYMQENEKIGANFAAMSPGDASGICTIVRGEILFGVQRLPRGKRRDDLQLRADKVLYGLKCFDIPEDAGDQYAAVKLATRIKGYALNENDLWIAATTLALGATLITRDSDFSRVPGLLIRDWSI